MTLPSSPWGATEPHNLHLPYGTDVIETERIGQEAVRLATKQGAKVILLPTVPFGVNTGQLDIPLTINMNPSTQMALLVDVVTSLERHRVPRLVVLNGHGGNDFRQMIREISVTHTMFIASANWYRSVPLRDFFDAPGDHADEMETSLMMFLAPELVLPLSRGRRRKGTPHEDPGIQGGMGVDTQGLAARHRRHRHRQTPRPLPPRREPATSRRSRAPSPRFLVELSSTDPAHMYETE